MLVIESISTYHTQSRSIGLHYVIRNHFFLDSQSASQCIKISPIPNLDDGITCNFQQSEQRCRRRDFFFFNSLGKQSRWPTEESQNFSCPVRCLHPARNQIYNRTDAFPECWEPKGEQTRKHRVNIHIRPKKKKNQLQSHKTNIITGNTVVCIFSLFFFLSWRRLQNNDLNTD